MAVPTAISVWLLLVLVSPLTQAQNDCRNAHGQCLPNWLNGTYYIRPEGSENASCPAQPCLTPSQLRDDFFACDRYNSCQTANTSLVLLPGIYTVGSNHGQYFPPTNYVSLTGYDEDCNKNTLPTAIIDCGGTWISLSFQLIKCVQVRNCVVFTGHDANVVMDRVIFNDTLIRMASIIVDDYPDLDYNYTTESQSYCLLQNQLADSYNSTPSSSTFALRNVSFSSDYHSTCARDYGILLTTIYAFGSVLDITDCTFSQNAVNQISLHGSTLHMSGVVQFENANTAIEAVNSTINLAGTVKFINNGNSSIRAEDTYSNIIIVGIVEFINNSAYTGGAIVSLGNVTIADNAQVIFQGNRAGVAGGAIISYQDVTLEGTVQFINNSAYNGGAITSIGSITIADNSQVVFEGNHADYDGGAIASNQHVTLAGTVKFINNTSTYNGGAIDTYGSVTIADSAQINFQGNHADNLGGAIACGQGITLEGTVKFINNSADNLGGAIFSERNVTIANNARVDFQGNHGDNVGGAIASIQHVTLAGTVKFINNSANQGGAIYSDGNVTIANNAQMNFQGNHADNAGGAIVSVQHVTLAGTLKFINNSASNGGSIKGVVTIADSAQVIFQGNHGDSGGAIYSTGNVTIANNAHVLFQGNHADKAGGAIFPLQDVTLAGTVEFINNSAYNGGAIVSIFAGDVTIADNARVVFQGNRADNGGGAIFSYHLTLAKNAEVIFQGNDALFGGAIVAFQEVNLEGTVEFINNTALTGGAIFLTGSGDVTIADNVHVIFQGNHADHVGGAIFSTVNDISQFLFSESHYPFCRISSGVNSTVEFINNTAKSGGSAMYGITVSKMVCGVIDHSHDYVYDNLFDIFTVIPDNSSSVSSDPLRVCICLSDQSTPECLAILPDQNIHYTVYPGQNFTIPAAVVGFNFALTSGSVYTQLLNSDASLGSESQYVQGVSHTGCSQLQYSVLSDKKQETLVLTTNGRSVAGIANRIENDIETQNSNNFSVLLSAGQLHIASNPNKYYINDAFATNLTDGVFRLAGYVQRSLQETPVFVSLTLLDCPPGFTLSGQSHSCQCDDRVLKNHLTCNITDQTIRRHTTIWVNASFIGNTSNGVIIHKHCPFEYCKPEQLDVNLTHPEIQCAFNHYGTLCGACKAGLSLALGSSQCLSHCSNKYLSLLIPFGLAGFALVFFIKILNLTVSQGTINGLIFYANIVVANQSIFFPAQYSRILSFLSVFISWLNLDLGIVTCFIKGLDGYWKTWLQFAFPFYVWVIAGAIILVSHYSTRATKIFGDNSVSVLATLLLLSYAKLLRSIITILSFTTLEYPDNFASKVWAFDGNIRFFSPKHIPLFLFAFVNVLLLWLPYTAVLLSAKWLRRKTHLKGLHWLMPFLDVYYGPFKDKHHYWVGVLLMVRGVLFVLFASFFAIESNVNLLLVIVSSVLLLLYTSITGRLYKMIYLTALENSFFVNLAVLAAGTYHIRLVGGSQEALVTTSVGIAFLQFVGITAFHSYHFVIVPIRKKCNDYVKTIRAEHRITNNNTELEPVFNSDCSDSNSDDEDRPRNAVTHSEVRLSELREEAAQLLFSPTTAEHQLPPAVLNIDPLKKQTDSAANEAAGALKESEAAAVPLDESPLRYFAAERESRFIDFTAPRESLLEFTQYHVPEESNEPPRYFAAKREDSIDFTAPRESLLEFTQ